MIDYRERGPAGRPGSVDHTNLLSQLDNWYRAEYVSAIGMQDRKVVPRKMAVDHWDKEGKGYLRKPKDSDLRNLATISRGSPLWWACLVREVST